MSTPDTVMAQLQSLLASANDTTGRGDTTLTDAVASLVEGYGKGGGGSAEESLTEFLEGTCTYFVVPEGTQKIKSYAFAECTELVNISLPDSLETINHYAFRDLEKLKLEKLPTKITYIGTEAFRGCKNLALTSLPSNLTTLLNRVFQNTAVMITRIPEKITGIGTNCFGNCLSMKTVTFDGKPTSINTAAFNGSTNITDIYVPWADGEVAGAPWGATNATIHYNHKGDNDGD